MVLAPFAVSVPHDSPPGAKIATDQPAVGCVRRICRRGAHHVVEPGEALGQRLEEDVPAYPSARDVADAFDIAL